MMQCVHINRVRLTYCYVKLERELSNYRRNWIKVDWNWPQP